jgi:hypothetical protein
MGSFRRRVDIVARGIMKSICQVSLAFLVLVAVAFHNQVADNRVR